MRAFVTGGTGFIGGYVVRALVERGDEVTALVRTPDRASALKELGVTIAPGDITEPSTLAGPMRHADAVFHLAAWYQLGITDRTRMYQINVRGTEHVLQAAMDAGVGRVVHCSSIAAIGLRPYGDVADETATHSPVFRSTYEETKWQSHHKALAFASEGLPVVVVMPGGVYGPADPSVIGQLIRFYAKGWLVACPFLKTEFSLVHVEDLADGFLAANDKGRPGEEYILGGENGSVKEVFERIEPLTGIRPPRFGMPPWLVRAATPISPLAARVLHQGPHIIKEGFASMEGSWMASSAKAQRELGYAFRGLTDALPPVVEWFKEN